MNYLIEIRRGRSWAELELSGTEKVKYNILINEMGNPSSRSISHSNTYTIPRSQQNIEALGFNVFNSTALTAALNTKYDCRIRANGKIIVEGYLVINKPSETGISINIIDKALSLLDKWGSTTLSTMLNSELRLNLPAAYKTAVEAMINYQIKDAALTALPNISGQTFPYALFPNTLNCIGDKFNNLTDGSRIPVDRINPYQSRPLFNTRAFLDSICYAYGYTPVYGSRVDQSRLKTHYLVPSGGTESIGFDSLIGGVVQSNVPEWDNSNPPSEEGDRANGQQSFLLAADLGTGSRLKASEIPGWVDPSGLISHPNAAYTYRNWRDQYNIYVPIPLRSEFNDWQGKIIINAGITAAAGYDLNSLDSKHLIKAIWRNTTSGAITFTDPVIDGSGDWYNWVNVATRSSIEIKIDKDQFRVPPAGTTMVGILHLMHFSHPYDYVSGHYYDPHAINMNLTEEYVGHNQLVYNDNDEYFVGVPNLTRNAPTETIKELLSLILTQQGMLCDIVESTKQVKFFQYDDINLKITNGDVEDWSKYLIRSEIPEYDTSFGDKYAKINRLSLSDPYSGNYYDLMLSDQSTKSKYDSFIEQPVEGLKDVSAIQAVNLSGTHIYFEYTNEGLGLVYSGSSIARLIQTRANGTTYGSITVPYVQNTNYWELPTGIVSWYEIINKGIRVTSKFFLPQSIIKTIDLSKPVYISHLRSSFIIEKVGEYQDGQTPVEVSLIIPGFVNDTIHFDFEFTILTDQLWLRYSSLTGKYYLHGLSISPWSVNPQVTDFQVADFTDSDIPFVTQKLRTPINGEYFELRTTPEGSIWHSLSTIATTYDMVEFLPVYE